VATPVVRIFPCTAQSRTRPLNRAGRAFWLRFVEGDVTTDGMYNSQVLENPI
jgi:hypothetical protein